MPFINGRYYVNPIMGEALEAAREAEAALAALQYRPGLPGGQARQNDGADAIGGGSNEGYGDANSQPDGSADGPIHRVEIEAAELVPAHSGRAARGYVARVHRSSAVSAGDSTRRTESHGGATSGHGIGPSSHVSGHTEAHVFTNHRDLVGFLRDEFAKDGEAHRRRS